MATIAPQHTIKLAAEIFVDNLGTLNRKFLRRNLENVETNSDAMAALKRALDHAAALTKENDG